jgi:hypothetical protein
LYDISISVVDVDHDDNTTIVLINDNSTSANAGVTINGNIITITKKGTYSLSGSLSNGQIIIDAGDAKVELELTGVSIACTTSSPIYVKSADKVEISAKKGYENYIYDLRTKESDSTDSSNGAIFAQADLVLKGQGKLNIESTYSHGVSTKDDLEIKNLTLNVLCPNDAIRGSDSLTITSGNITAISTLSDALKTTNSSVSDKGNQRGTIAISGGTLDLYSATDSVDASYNVEISGEPIINIHTEKYSPYSQEITTIANSFIYVRFRNGNGFNPSSYKYSALFKDASDNETWANLTSFQTNTGGPGNQYIYYKVNVPNNAVKIEVFAYNTNQSQQSSTLYAYKTDSLTINTNYDTLSLTLSNNKLTASWTNYTTQGGPGNDGNTDKADFSCKGIKADNEIIINSGNITIQSHDDGIHGNGGTTLENGGVGLGNILINDGIIEISSDDDGIHSDVSLTLNGGSTTIVKSYEGLEGNVVNLNGGINKINSSDDGTNAGSLLNITGGYNYLIVKGDGLDSNSNTTISGGTTIVLGPNSGGNTCLDSEKGFVVTGGVVLGISSSSAMWTSDVKGHITGKYIYNFNVGNVTSNFAVTNGSDLALFVNLPFSGSLGAVYLATDATSSFKFVVDSTYSGTLDSFNVGFTGTISGGTTKSVTVG